MPLTTIHDTRFRSDRAPDWAVVLREALEQIRGFAGCLGATALEDVDDPLHLVVVEEWESADAFEAYRAWRAGGSTSPLGDLLASPPGLVRTVPRPDL